VGYTSTEWLNRLSERTDLSTSIVHLTRRGSSNNILDQLLKILTEKKLIGSTTESGFIVGSIPAVCFQDAPLHSICQNVWFEQKFRKTNNTAKVRYLAAGLAFKKNYAYKRGARPVLYEQTREAKKILPREEWWRIVNFDLSDDDSIIDWTHEREWRAPNDFKFAISKATILVPNGKAYRQLMEACEDRGLDFHRKVRGIVVMAELLF